MADQINYTNLVKATLQGYPLPYDELVERLVVMLESQEQAIRAHYAEPPVLPRQPPAPETFKEPAVESRFDRISKSLKHNRIQYHPVHGVPRDTDNEFVRVGNSIVLGQIICEHCDSEIHPMGPILSGLNGGLVHAICLDRQRENA